MPSPRITPPSPSFAHNWTRLPTELKVHILNYTLPHTQTFTATDFCRKHTRRNTRRHSSSSFETHVLPLLACPFTAVLAKEAFYRNNTFLVSNWSFTGHITLPPPAVRPHIRQLKLQLQFSARALTALQALPLFPHLLRVAIDITGVRPDTDCVALYYRLLSMDPIHIATRSLAVLFRYTHEQDLYRYGGKVAVSKAFAPRLDGLVLEKLCVVWEGWKVKKRTVRRVSFLEGVARRVGALGEVQEWPGEVPEGCLVHVRETRREMWV
ncbi:hypothetical protein IQ07DRAFT_641368 [Pyrenochaeta sp. DS3sAY3a]|nr:hypothetical protein IQ07DRAFT_641368 [Pyrenochaeta sp. DS3sAY3a]